MNDIQRQEIIDFIMVPPLFGIASLFVSMMFVVPEEWNTVRFVLLSVGVSIGIVTGFLTYKQIESDQIDQQTRRDIVLVQNGLTPKNHTIIVPEPKKPQEFGRVVHSHKIEVTLPNGETRITEIEDDDKPPQEFIEWCHVYSMNDPKQHVPEREAAKTEWKSNANKWLSIMERTGIFAREGDNPNASRIWRHGVSEANALAAYGYMSEEFLPHQAIPPAPPTLSTDNSRAHAQ